MIDTHLFSAIPTMYRDKSKDGYNYANHYQKDRVCLINQLPSTLSSFYTVNVTYHELDDGTRHAKYHTELFCRTCQKRHVKTYKRQPTSITCKTCSTVITSHITTENIHVSLYDVRTSEHVSLNTNESISTFHIQFAVHKPDNSRIKTTMHTIEIRVVSHTTGINPTVMLHVDKHAPRNISYGSLPYFVPTELFELLRHEDVLPYYNKFVDFVFEKTHIKWYDTCDYPSFVYIGFFLKYPALLSAPPTFVKDWIDEHITASCENHKDRALYQSQYERTPNLRFDKHIKKELGACNANWLDVLNLYGWNKTDEVVAHLMYQHPDKGDIYRLVTYLFSDTTTQYHVLTYMIDELEKEKERILQDEGIMAWLKMKNEIHVRLYTFYLRVLYKWSTIKSMNQQHVHVNPYYVTDWGNLSDNQSDYGVIPPTISLRPKENGDLDSRNIYDYVQSELKTTLTRATNHLTDEQTTELTELTRNSLKPFNWSLSVVYPDVFYKKGAVIYNKAQGIPNYFYLNQDKIADYLTNPFITAETYIAKLTQQLLFVSELIHMHDLVVYYECDPYVTFKNDLATHDIYAFHRELYCRAFAYTTHKVKREINNSGSVGWRNTTYFTNNGVDVSTLNVPSSLAILKNALDPTAMLESGYVTTTFNAVVQGSLHQAHIELEPHPEYLHTKYNNVSKNGYTSQIISTTDELVGCMLQTENYNPERMKQYVKRFTNTQTYLYTTLICNTTRQIVGVVEWYRLNKNSTCAHIKSGLYHERLKQNGTKLAIKCVNR